MTDDANTEGSKLAKLALILFLKERDAKRSWYSACKTCGKRRKAWAGLCNECARKLEGEIARMPS